MRPAIDITEAYPVIPITDCNLNPAGIHVSRFSWASVFPDSAGIYFC